MDKLNHHTKYRADIDGLRALAILPVVFYHAFPNSLPGGFIGVDIFFVISGFLISTIIFRELEQGHFSFSGFYARRVRRLFPALILVLSFVLGFGWFALDADEFKMLGKHVTAGVGFVQNIILWGEVGYFDVSSELKPLLHLWSLAIEEQFYLFFPLIIWFAWRLRISFFALVLVLATGSLALNLVWIHMDQVGTFYFPHTRIWELMAGAILASVASGSNKAAQQIDTVGTRQIGQTLSKASGSLTSFSARIVLTKSVLSSLGLGLIILSTLVFDKTDLYPGWRAVVPVAGAVLIIYAGQSSLINRHLLSNKLVVFIGLISYPLYLWHWPLLSFAKIIEIEPLSILLRTTLITISFFLAILSYIFIEKPIRSGGFQRAWTIALIIIMFCIGALGFLASERELTSRIGASVEEVKAWEKQRPRFEENCNESFSEWNDRRDSFKCIFLDKGKPEIVVIGDSHARRLHYGISYFFGEQYNIALFPSGCAMPFYDISVAIPKKTRVPGYSYLRAKLINKALDFSISEPSVEMIVLTTSACWRDIVDIKNLEEKDAKRIVESKMRLTFERLSESGKKILYVLDNPGLNFDPKACVTRPFRINSKTTACKMKREVYDNYRVEYFEIARRVLSEYPNIKVFDVASKLCDSEYCYAVIDNKLLYQDVSHLNYEGSKYVSEFMVPLIRKTLTESQ